MQEQPEQQDEPILTESSPKLGDSSPKLGSNNYTSKLGISNKSGSRIQMKRRQLIANIFLSGGAKRKEKPKYEIDMQVALYNNEHHCDKSMLLMKDDIIPVEESESGRGPRVHKYLIRCFRHESAKVCAVLMLLSIFFTTIVAPLTFIWGGTWDDAERVPGGRPVLVIDVLMDFVFLTTAVLIGLNTTYLDHKCRVEVVDRRKIVRRALQRPSYIVMLLSTTCHLWIACFNAPMLINVAKFVRCWQFFDLPDALIWWSDRRRYRFGRLLLLSCCAAHWVACLMAYSTGYREALDLQGAEMFETSFNGDTVSGYHSLYWMALVESVFLLCGSLDNPLGDGTLRQRNFMSLVFVVAMCPVGCLIVAVLISMVTREQTLKYALDMQHEENKAFMRRAMDSLSIPPQLQRRVFSLHYFQRMSHDKLALKELLRSENLSKPLELALRLYIYRKVLASGFFDTTHTSYILEVVRVLEDHIYIPGDYVCRRGEVGSEMFFVSQGELLVLVPSVPGSDQIKDAVGLKDKKVAGEYFGEIMIIKSCPRTAWVRAETYVVCAVLKRDHVETIWKYFPEEREKVVRSVRETLQRDRWRAMRKAAKQHLQVRKEAQTNGCEEPSGDVVQPQEEPEAPQEPDEQPGEQPDADERPAGGAEPGQVRRLTLAESRAAALDEEAKALQVPGDRSEAPALEVLCAQILEGQQAMQEQIRALGRRQDDLEALLRGQERNAHAESDEDRGAGDPAGDGAESAGQQQPQAARTKRRARTNARHSTGKKGHGGILGTG